MNGASIGNGRGTNTTTSEATRAEGNESLDPEAEATEHDVSTAAESLDPNSESQLHTVEEDNDEDFDDMMDHLLERDGVQDGSVPPPPILAEVILIPRICCSLSKMKCSRQLTASNLCP